MMTPTIEMLKSVAAWYRLAAEELEAGREGRARQCAKLGRLGADSHMLARWLANDPLPDTEGGRGTQ